MRFRIIVANIHFFVMRFTSQAPALLSRSGYAKEKKRGVTFMQIFLNKEFPFLFADMTLSFQVLMQNFEHQDL